MRTLNTWSWTILLAVGSSALAQSQIPNQPGTTKKTAPASRPAPATTPATGGKGTADPNVEKAKAQPADTRAELQQVLVQWQARSEQVKSLDVLFDKIDRSDAWGSQYFQGRAMLQSPDLACLQFQKYKVDGEGKPLFATTKDGRKVPDLEPEPYERIVCTGKEVLQYSWEDRKIFVFPLDKQARRKALQQGPLPFLFNMKAEEATRRYSMTLIKPEKPDNENHVIAIVPNEEIDKESFSRAFLWLSKETYLPSRLRLYNLGDKDYQEFLFTGNYNTIVKNKEMKQELFAATKIDGWKVIENPGGDAPARPKDAGAAPAGRPVVQQRRPATQPATNASGRPRQ